MSLGCIERDGLLSGRAEMLRQLARTPSPSPSIDEDEVLVEKEEVEVASGSTTVDSASTTSLASGWLSSNNKNREKRWKEPQVRGLVA